jgi:hypothetical protein
MKLEQTKTYLLLTRKTDNEFMYLSPVVGERTEFNSDLYDANEFEDSDKLIQFAAANQIKIGEPALIETVRSVVGEAMPDATEAEKEFAIAEKIEQCRNVGIVKEG